MPRGRRDGLASGAPVAAFVAAPPRGDVVIVGAALAALVLLAAGELAARREPDRATQRLERLVARRPGRRRRERGMLEWMDRRLVQIHLVASLERRLHEAAVPLTVSEALLAVTAVAGGTGSAAGAWRGPLTGALAAGSCPLLVWWGLGAIRDRRIRQIERQLPAALDLLVGQLRTHRSIVEAITEVARVIAEPLRGEYARLAEELRLGAPLGQALEALRRRVPSRPVEAMVTAIVIADGTGGNLAEFLARQCRTVREQVAFLQEVRSATAHARSTAAILALLPVGVALAMALLDPRVFAPLTTTGAGRALLAVAGGMELTGWQVIRAMIRSVER